MTSAHTVCHVGNLNIHKYALTVQSFGEPLTATMNKYTREHVQVQQGANAPGVILMLAHGVGFLKEMWEPVIEHVFRLDEAGSPTPLIREIWALDSPNHGEACIRNENILIKPSNRLSLWDYADAFAELYKSGLLESLDSRKHHVVLCGHSAGAAAVVLATSFFNPLSRIPFNSLILVDPTMWTRDWHGKENKFYKTVVQATPLRRDIFKNRDEASEWLYKTMCRAWDKRVFLKYVEHGIRPLPTAFYPDCQGVTLATHRLVESSCFSDRQAAPVCEAVDRLNQICSITPVHIVYGARNDMYDRKLQDALISPEDGRSFASIRRIPGAGHLVPQEKPTEMAKEIFDILQKGFKLSSML